MTEVCLALSRALIYDDRESCEGQGWHAWKEFIDDAACPSEVGHPPRLLAYCAFAGSRVIERAPGVFDGNELVVREFCIEFRKSIIRLQHVRDEMFSGRGVGTHR